MKVAGGQALDINKVESCPGQWTAFPVLAGARRIAARAARRDAPLVPAHRRGSGRARCAWARSRLPYQFLLPLHAAGNARVTLSPHTV